MKRINICQAFPKNADIGKAAESPQDEIVFYF